MNQSIQFTLSPNALKSLGELVAVPKNALSPFEASRTFEQVQLAALQKNTILGSDGRPTPEVRTTLEVLAAPTAYTQLRLFANPEFHEHICFCNADGTHRILLTTAGAEVLVSDPAPLDDLIAWMQDYVGTSTLRALTFSAELDPNQGLVLAALIDLHRRAGLRALADQTEFTPPAFNLPAINDAIARTKEDTQWLVGVMKMIASPLQQKVPDLGATLDRLVAARHINRDGTRYQLGDAAALLAERLVVIDLVLLLSAGQLVADDAITTTQLLCLQAGAHDILTIETYDATVHFECLSAAAIMAFVRHLFTQAHKLAQTIQTSASKCPRCNAPITPTRRFCAHCGLALTT